MSVRADKSQSHDPQYDPVTVDLAREKIIQLFSVQDTWTELALIGRASRESGIQPSIIKVAFTYLELELIMRPNDTSPQGSLTYQLSSDVLPGSLDGHEHVSWVCQDKIPYEVNHGCNCGSYLGITPRMSDARGLFAQNLAVQQMFINHCLQELGAKTTIRLISPEQAALTIRRTPL